MKKALIVTAVSGFLVQFEQENVRLLQRLGYEVHYASNRKNPVYQYEEEIFEKLNIHFHQVDIEQSPLCLYRHHKARRQLEKLIETEEISLIHCHTPVGGVLGRLAGKTFSQKGIKVIYTVHGFHFYRGCKMPEYIFFRWLESRMAKFTDAIVTINQEDYKAAESFCLKDGGRVYLLPGTGVDMQYYDCPDEETRIRKRECMFDAGLCVLVSVGELRRNKNQQIILKALGRLKKEGYDIHDVRYVLVGEGADKNRLKRLSEKCRIENQVIFAGYQKDVRPYLRAADALVFPSFREGLGMAALESLSMGIPVLASDNRGTREYMIHGGNGLVYDASDIKDVVNTLKGFIENRKIWQETIRRKRIRQSVERFQKSYSKDVMEYVYRQTLQERSEKK